jgi:uncharacterized protein (DUF1501 family)
MERETRLGRRALLRGGTLGALGLALGAAPRAAAAGADADGLTAVPDRERKLLFVVCAHGGAAIIDSLLPVLESDVGDQARAATLDVYPESLLESVPSSAFRVVKPLAASDYGFMRPPPGMADFVRRHGADTAVFCHDVTSVNHNVAQARSLNGAGANAGRTLMEAMALRYGGGLHLPSCNMGTDGFIEHGSDPSLPVRARHEAITSPLLFATGTHGFRGLPELPRAALIARARAARERLDQASVFARTFEKSPLIRQYLAQRRFGVNTLEQADLIEKLLLLDPGQGGAAVAPGPLAQQLLTRLPSIARHDVHAQLALGFLLAYHGVSTSVTFGFRSDPVITQQEGVITAPIAFDYSHSSHRITQSVMWGNLLSVLDTLITLLKEYDYLGDPALGKMWNRSLIYVATDFGRTKTRPSGAGQWGSGHDLNNGSLIVSPLVRGNRVYGGVDPKTCLSYGFDPQTGAPDRGRVLEEGAVYGAIAHALDIRYAGRADCPALLRV